MNLLALETSAETASVALMMGGDILIREGGTPGTHARFVLPWVAELLAESGLTLGKLDAVAFSSGPGSFTGLRLAVSVAQGLALGADLPVVDVPTLDALALACGDGTHLCCVDARMSEVYSGRFDVSGSDVVARSALSVGDPSALQAPDGVLSAWQGCGSGFALEPVLALPWVSSLRAVRASVSAHAREVARLGQVRLGQGLGQDAALAAPRYVRDKVAQTTAERLAAGGRA
ncbi:MAG: tRNA (adenosine(37)-N6)-threonylcarbamoyltransferase complex dimerization subunit type 1 TsaB [Gammaproteobacteria bacterium]|jgi:tRNA threonylcarbamoyladenosine biosynthesis protein TsaB|nr:tRNA (adenosine(37)-N6)-threonylcarbamoyltransferase complex dimerization subunit type 1 TsaB [Gammaproteobacteria bacterium]MBU0773403.1 tRNA (adenosine(37)-N6)-threonylcarbamoyltransferase complex dimerization subunit type 1 TsaB [Gammaproteobacteria bacterium]MBU0857393.1 tRNA (adenosine(37)-N6)-threonylcarbamoyltransferase complex dimerization subunit type 1 TsaB [Gammaproteobacteria bacterium]MBU1846856.1 tRNA (adenosine(37)-N6)-threonylcarbamoyltransferase complex dimerization subunit t